MRIEVSSHKLRGPRCLSSHNRTYRQFLARSSPLQAVSPEKDCAGQSFVARGPPVHFGQPRAASARTTALTGSLSCKARPYKQLCKTAQGRAVWPTVPQLAQALTDSFVPAGHLYASASPGPPQLGSPLYKQLRKTAGQSCRTSTNGQFFARSSPLQAVSQEKDSAGQSFVARGPPACFAQPRAASAKLAPI